MVRDVDAVTIRPYQLSDAASLLEAAHESIAEVGPWMPWCTPDLDLAKASEWIEKQIAQAAAGGAFEFAIVSEDGRYLGACGINRVDAVNRWANLGYWVRTSAARRGVASTAVRQLVRWTFGHTNLNRIEILVATRNTASLRVAEKAGAVGEGVLRKRLLLYGVAHDAVVFSFVREGDSA